MKRSNLYFILSKWPQLLIWLVLLLIMGTIAATSFSVAPAECADNICIRQMALELIQETAPLQEAATIANLPEYCRDEEGFVEPYCQPTPPPRKTKPPFP